MRLPENGCKRCDIFFKDPVGRIYVNETFAGEIYFDNGYLLLEVSEKLRILHIFYDLDEKIGFLCFTTSDLENYCRERGYKIKWIRNEAI